MLVPFIEEQKVISELRLGYTLNEYRHKKGLQESPLCSCCAIETVDHYVIVKFVNWIDKSYSHNCSAKLENKVSVQKSSLA